MGGAAALPAPAPPAASCWPAPLAPVRRAQPGGQLVGARSSRAAAACLCCAGGAGAGGLDNPVKHLVYRPTSLQLLAQLTTVAEGLNRCAALPACAAAAAAVACWVAACFANTSVLAQCHSTRQHASTHALPSAPHATRHTPTRSPATRQTLHTKHSTPNTHPQGVYPAGLPGTERQAAGRARQRARGGRPRLAPALAHRLGRGPGAPPHVPAQRAGGRRRG